MHIASADSFPDLKYWAYLILCNVASVGVMAPVGMLPAKLQVCNSLYIEIGLLQVFASCSHGEQGINGPDAHQE